MNHGTLDPVKRIADVRAEEWEEGFRRNVGSAVELVCLFFFLPARGGRFEEGASGRTKGNIT